MRVNTAKSIKTANTVRAHFGTWKAAKDSAFYDGDKFVVRGVTNATSLKTNTESAQKKD